MCAWAPEVGSARCNLVRRCGVAGLRPVLLLEIGREGFQLQEAICGTNGETFSMLAFKRGGIVSDVHLAWRARQLRSWGQFLPAVVLGVV